MFTLPLWLITVKNLTPEYLVKEYEYMQKYFVRAKVKVKYEWAIFATLSLYTDYIRLENLYDAPQDN